MKFLALYRSSVPAKEMMAGATPQDQQAGMDAWMQWMQRSGDGIVDIGAPLGDATSVPGGAASGNGSHVTGYSIVQADSRDGALALMEGHPHLSSPGNPTIELIELLPVPGM